MKPSPSLDHKACPRPRPPRPRISSSRTCDNSPRVELQADDVSLVRLELAVVPHLNPTGAVDDAHVPQVHVASKVAARQNVTLG